jgi:uridine kinase
VQARVVLLAGASGSGKSFLCRRLGLPVLTLDDFYRDGDDPALPRRFGIVDWDDAASWDAAGAVAAVERLCRLGASDVPVYDIPSSRRTGTVRLDLAAAGLFVAEGIFAAEVVATCRALGILADALCLQRHPAVNFGRRLLRDLAESRKPPLTLMRRGVALARAEPQLVRRWTALGCEPTSVTAAERRIRTLSIER